MTPNPTPAPNDASAAAGKTILYGFPRATPVEPAPAADAGGAISPTPTKSGRKAVVVAIAAGVAVGTLTAVVILDLRKAGSARKAEPAVVHVGVPRLPPSATPAATANPPEKATTGVAPSSGAAVVGMGSCRVRIESRPPGAAVMIDGQAAGTAPVEVKGILCGHPIVVLAGKPQYEMWQKTVTTREGDEAVVVAALRRPRTVLRIESTPPGATVLLNHKDIGITPLTTEVSAFTTALLTLRKAGYRASRRITVPRAGADNLVSEPLEPLSE